MKIAVVFTGGTIGSRQSGGWISPDSTTKYALIEEFKRTHGDDIEFSFFTPFTILSENISAKEINCLIKLLKDLAAKDFDGIVVTHGTDSLIFSGCALSYAMGSDCKPIVLVSSNFPLNDERANGHINFAFAIDFFRKGGNKGVFISYKNRDGAARVINPLLALSYLEGDDRLFTLCEESAAKNISPLDFTLCDNHRILVIGAHPGDDFAYCLDGTNAVIFRPYHSGTLNTASEKLKAFCKRAADKSIPLFLTNAPIGATYETASLYKELGVLPLENRTFTSAFIRLWIGISLGEDLKAFMTE